MGDSSVQVFIAVFGDESGANEALRDFQAANRQGSIDLIDAAVIVRSADGKLKIEETADPDGRRWGKRGLLAGGLVGLIFPPSLIVSAGVGGAAGALWGKFRDKGFSDDDLRQIGESIEPGTSAIIAIAEDRVVEQLETGLEGYRRIARHALSAEAAVIVTADELDLEAEAEEAASTKGS